MIKVLIVEDEMQIAKMYQFKLEASDYEVMLASNGDEGLKTAREFKPDLILLDLMMPVMSGDVMLEKLRAKSWGSNMRVIVLTNISKDEAPSKLRLLGVDRYIIKAHYTPSQIIEMVDGLMKPVPKNS